MHQRAGRMLLLLPLLVVVRRAWKQARVLGAPLIATPNGTIVFLGTLTHAPTSSSGGAFQLSNPQSC
jgi:hypothetical protein